MKRVTLPYAGEDGKKLSYTHTLLVRRQNGTATLENSLSVYHKLSLSLTNNCTLMHLSQKKRKTFMQNREIKPKKKLRAQMFPATLFVITQNWNQPRCL